MGGTIQFRTTSWASIMRHYHVAFTETQGGAGEGAVTCGIDRYASFTEDHA